MTGMATISIDIDSSKNEIYLVGDIDRLMSNRFAWRYVKSYHHPRKEVNRIVIPIGDAAPVEVLAKVQSMLLKYGFEEKKSNSSEKILQDFYEKEKQFSMFSKQALSIRNNKCNSDEFRTFTEVVSNNLSSRSLYPLQLLSAYHLAFSQNACNFSVPGAGKTSIVYGAYTYLKSLSEDNAKKIDKLLIVGPLSSFGPWELEYAECFGRHPDVKRLISEMSRSEKKEYLYSKRTAEITLISYASLATLQEDLGYYLRYNKVMMVLDEAHKAKNTSGGIIAQAVLELSKFSRARVVLTGTPAPNGYEDLYNMFKFIWPNKKVIGFEVNQLRDMSTRVNDSRVERLLEDISPYFIRIKKSDLNIPPAITNPPILVDMAPIQQSIYNFIEKKYVDAMIDNGGTSPTSCFKALLMKARMVRLMQAASNPAMLKEPLCDFISNEEYPLEEFQTINDTNVLNSIMTYEQNETPVKYDVVKNLVEKIISNGGKVVIWATFIHTIQGLKTYFANNGIKSQELYGAIPVEKNGIIEESENQILTRERIVREFQSNECPYKVIIANPFAVAESISLHKACHNAIYIERSFNVAHFMQSKDRIHRYGLEPKTETNYYYILSKNSIDETIDRRLWEKEQRMMDIMENMPIPLFDNVCEDLGDEDIKALIKDYVKRTKKP